MRHRRLDLVQTKPEPAHGSLGRREALAAMIGGALLAGAACSSNTVESFGDGGASSDDAGSSDDTGSTSACDSPPPGDDVGDASTFASGTWSAAGTRNNPYIVGQDAMGFFAFSAICTHQGCQIGSPSSSTGKTSCPCHGAQFDGNGAVLRGPARQALPHFAVALCGGHVYVDSSTTVDASTRTPAS
ncbi:MAG: Rieske (2Fe-2S) protein [Polyangiaceae bacterium]